MNNRKLTLAAFLLLAVSCKERQEIVVFHAASLTSGLAAVAEAYQRAHPGVRVRLEPSGSQVAARKVAELGLVADVVAVADPDVISRILVPNHARLNVVFALGELVLAHGVHSRGTEHVSTENWLDVLLRKEVRLGCADADSAPIGYRTLQMWRLAALYYHRSDLAPRLEEHCAPGRRVPDEAELLALLSSRAVDYVFVYRSTANDHHLKTTTLPADINLGSADKAQTYSSVAVEARMAGNQRVSLPGAPIQYALTIPLKARNVQGGRQLAAFILGPEGARLLRRSGYQPIATEAMQALPPELRSLIDMGSSQTPSAGVE